MRLWRKAGSPEPAAANSAAAGARYGSPKERRDPRLKGDAQETARHRLVITSALLVMAFVAIALRMSYVSVLREGGEPTQRVAPVRHDRRMSWGRPAQQVEDGFRAGLRAVHEAPERRRLRVARNRAGGDACRAATPTLNAARMTQK